MSEPPIPSEGEFTNLRRRDFQFRGESRYKSPLAAVAYVRRKDGPDKPEMVWMANLSYNGLGFLCKTPVQEKIHLLIHIPVLGSARDDVAAEVMHSTQQLNGDWLVGCRLETPLSHEELEQCLTAEDEFFSRTKR